MARVLGAPKLQVPGSNPGVGGHFSWLPQVSGLAKKVTRAGIYEQVNPGKEG